MSEQADKGNGLCGHDNDVAIKLKGAYGPF
jgi:hypothetical protein